MLGQTDERLPIDVILCAGCAATLEFGRNLAGLFEEAGQDVYQCRLCQWLTAVPHRQPSQAPRQRLFCTGAWD